MFWTGSYSLNLFLLSREKTIASVAPASSRIFPFSFPFCLNYVLDRLLFSEPVSVVQRETVASLAPASPRIFPVSSPFCLNYSMFWFGYYSLNLFLLSREKTVASVAPASPHIFPFSFPFCLNYVIDRLLFSEPVSVVQRETVASLAPASTNRVQAAK